MIEEEETDEGEGLEGPAAKAAAAAKGTPAAAGTPSKGLSRAKAAEEAAVQQLGQQINL